ncbi:hypothetical protein MCOR27_000370 [Pyricularia oryzae]|uniref:Uncharacterized protein n=2 Tax=Pyricularia TaxID=48558 RepID=A0ABQ8NR14_PYRGI|nr:hypothetical protein MCOR01_000815 [Pyricularia oryzae]KAI6300896.1 hypothetical protein MCOR33_003521 [Pyricularia grisea]KAH9428421.1 hypothetical protein MCOR02_010974 [Pyricularia oryzae]KAI6259961.1 hypothetical protein MCOR19_003684 [Pyricularia oryzae]KAI6285510.1 hypothetical protein MCOR26_001486 [Pyricularia oryzae]
MPASLGDHKTSWSRQVNTTPNPCFGHAGIIASCMPYMGFNNNHQGPFSDLAGSAPQIMDTERAYLIDSMQRQSQRVRRLRDNFRRIEERLARVAVELGDMEASPCSNTTIVDGSTNGNERRKLRKEASLLKGRILEAEKQEHLALLRLNDFGIKNQGQEHVQGHFAPQTSLMFFPASPSDHQWQMRHQEPATQVLPPIQTILPQSSLLGPSALSPLSPPFIPGVMFSNSFSWDNKSQIDETTAEVRMIDHFSPTDVSGVGGLYWSTVPCLESIEASYSKTREKDAGVVRGADSRNSVSHCSISLNQISLGYAPWPQDKRMSMPSLRSIWP